MNLNYLNVGNRLGAVFGLLLLLLAGVAAQGIDGMARANQALDNIVEVNFYKMNLLEEMSRSMYIVAGATSTIVLLGSAAHVSGASFGDNIGGLKIARSNADCLPVYLERKHSARGSSTCMPAMTP